MLASKTAAVPKHLHALLRAHRAPAALIRPFASDVTTREPIDERSLEADRRSSEEPPLERRRGGDLLPIFSDVLDPFFPTKSLSQMMNLMDNFMDSPFGMGTRRSSRRTWDAREDDDGLYLRVDMPGLDKQDVRVTVEQDTLVIRGEGEEDEEEGARRYSDRVDLPSDLYKYDDIKAEMKNGVLKVFVPKLKEQERKDVVHVQIE